MELSPSGYWLATGNDQGECHIWDLLTNSVIQTIPPPEAISEDGKQAVTAISWSVPKRSLLIAYAGRLVSEWSFEGRAHDKSMEIERTLLFAAYNAQHKWILADGTKVQLIDEGMSVAEHVFEEAATAVQYFTATNCIIAGNAKGELIFLDATDLAFLGRQEDIGSAIMAISVPRHKDNMLMALLKDRSIKLFNLEDRKNLHFRLKFVDVINKASWAAAGFSHDGELAYGASKSKGSHAICLWELINGTIVKTLEGPREDIVSVQWHPKRPILVSLSKFGACFVWKPQYPKKWSALFPGMTEVEENVYYVEREDEFDEVQETVEAIQPEPDVVDITSLGPNLSPDDLLELHLFYSNG